MGEITIRKVSNGFIITELPSDFGDACQSVAASDKDMLDYVTKYFFGDHAEWDWVTPPSDDFEQPQTPDPQSSEGESTEKPVDVACYDDGSYAQYFADGSTKGFSADGVQRSASPPKDTDFETLIEESFSVPVSEVKEALTNGTTHPEQQD